MKSVRMSISVCALALSVGCGSSENKTAKEERTTATPSSEIVAQESTDTDTAIPQSVVVRIPVDAQGNPTGEPELRTVADGSSLESEQLVEAAFNSGTVAQTVSSEDELDADSSTQSWFLRRGFGFGGGFGRGFGGGWGGWGGFAPQLGFGGGFHNYGFGGGFHFGGYRYGCFNRFGW